MTRRINLDPRRIQVWQTAVHDSGKVERITWFGDGMWWSALYKVGFFHERSIPRSMLARILTTCKYIELTRSDA